MNRLLSTERTEATPRRAMTIARKRRIWERVAGKCWFCGKVTPPTGPGVVYDHKLPLELGGTDDDAQVFPLHAEPCNRIKTKADSWRIAKMRRQAKIHDEREPSRLQSRGFDRSLRRKFNGTVERREPADHQPSIEKRP